MEEANKTEPINIPKKKTHDIKDYMKHYKEINKEKLKEKMKEKHICDCKGKYTTSGKYLHNQTKKHKTYLESLL